MRVCQTGYEGGECKARKEEMKKLTGVAAWMLLMADHMD
jgi:hypothetical protein